MEAETKRVLDNITEQLQKELQTMLIKKDQNWRLRNHNDVAKATNANNQYHSCAGKVTALSFALTLIEMEANNG